MDKRGNMKVQYILVLIYAVTNISLVHAMTMRPACTVKYKKKKSPEDLRKDRKFIRGIVQEVRAIDGAIQKIRNGQQNSAILPNIFSRALAYGELGLVKAVIDVGADPNYNDGSGIALEKAPRLKIITTLLDAKADPKECKESVLFRPLYYYLAREKDSIDNWDKYRQEKERLAEKALTCVKLLLNQGVNPNQEYRGQLPLATVIRLDKKYYARKTLDFIKLLIWRGANPYKKETSNGNSIYIAHNSGRISFARYMEEEYKKYQAVRLLLIGNYKGNSTGGVSPFALLPKELLKEIGILVKNGFAFKPIIIKEPEKKIEPVIEAQGDKDQTELDKTESSEKTTVVEKNDTAQIPKENPESMKKYQPISEKKPFFYHFRRLSPKLLIGAAAVSIIGSWLYKKWKNGEEDEPDYNEWLINAGLVDS